MPLNELDTLIREMNPELVGEVAFCLMDEQAIRKLEEPPIACFREREGITVILPQGLAERCKVESGFDASMITLNVHSDLYAVGFLASISASLAAAGISVNVVSALFHDHLFVPRERANEAMEILTALARTGRSTS